MQKKLLMAAILAAAFCLSNVTWASNWDGSHSSDWRDLNNWSANALPAAGANWEILASTPHRLIVTDSFLDGTVTGRLIARDGFTITSGGSMSVAQLQHLGNPSHTPTLIQGTLNSAPGGSTASFWRVGTWTIDGGVLRVDRRMEFGTVSGTFTINVINGGRIEQMGTEFIITGNHSGGVTHVNITGANSRIINHDGGALPGSTARTLINRNNTAGRVTITNGGSWLMHETMARINTWIGNGWVRNNIPHEELVLTQIGNRVDVVGQRRTRAYNPSPAHGGSSAPGAVNLAWTKPLDSLLGTNVTSRVYFLENYPVDVNGLPTDPNGDTFPLIATMLPADAPSIMINTKPGARYGWRVDTMDNTLPANDPNTARIGRGQVWYFAIRNIAPVVEAGAMQRLGLNATGTATFNSNATVTDEGLPLGATVT
ncbi:MAG TPA: hypothetical protein VLH60_08170, partial [Sedimentisphaerales bacterium]|nr:hypothetical protein [Sedimentisphaerales bacterium]